ncbi:hypothetical protein HGM15179_020487 [Zosterops borbonicus]|uniref:ribonuclease H n=2 Tax=Zosterops borbonicus TaxID=364589 RepID=A0A8K1D7G4_9PASS|nr:hypothetical protein HGM15179_020487 [Zosterops borbonicus]
MKRDDRKEIVLHMAKKVREYADAMHGPTHARIAALEICMEKLEDKIEENQKKLREEIKEDHLQISAVQIRSFGTKHRRSSAECRPQLTFTWRGVQYTWNQLPQGWKHSPTICHRLIQTALEKDEAPEHLQYINNIIVWEDTAAELFEKGEKIIQILLKSHFTKKKSKVKGSAREIQFLEVKWQDGWHQILFEAINKITAMSPPINKKETQAFLGAIYGPSELVSPASSALQIPYKRVNLLGPDFRQRRDLAWKKGAAHTWWYLGRCLFRAKAQVVKV